MTTRPTNFQLRPLSLAWLLNLSIIVSLTTIFVGISTEIWFKEGFTWDVPVALAIRQWGQPWLDSVMRAISQTGAIGAGVFVIGVAVWFGWRQQWLNAAMLLAGFAGATVLNDVLKFLFERPRPAILSPLVVATSYDFPSGRTIAAVACYGMLAVFLWRRCHPGWAIASGTWVVVVAISQVYQGDHPPSDVLASLSVGVLWLFTIFAVYGVSARNGLQSTLKGILSG